MAQDNSKQEPQQGKQNFAALDEDFIRVLEDLIDALLNNGTLRLTDLPPHAQEKLNRRKRERDRLRNSLDLMPDDDSLI
ncbi:MAG: hypothetical protein ACI4QS_13220 [Comamonas sp.]